MSSPLISVIIPTYNRGYILGRAIDSVLAQTYKHFELIIVDDGSTDNTQEILESYKLANSEVIILNQENAGVSASRNRAIEMARGEYICFLDSDDEWLPYKLEEQVAFLKINPEYLWVHADEIWIRNGKRVNQMKKHKKGGGDQFLPSLHLCLVSPSTVMIHRNLLEKEKFKEDFIVCEDYDLWLRLLLDHPIGFIEKPLINKYGGHEDQLSRRYFAMDYWRVRSLASLLPRLYEQRLLEACEVGLKKSQILLAGYLKHQNTQHLSFIETQARLFQEHLQRHP